MISEELAKKILIIDDEKNFLNACKIFLRDFSNKIYLCTSGAVAIELLSIQCDFDIIFLDLGMPECSGMKVFEHIKINYPDLKKKVVFITGGAYDKESQLFLESLSNQILIKPFDLVDLTTTTLGSSKRIRK